MGSSDRVPTTPTWWNRLRQTSEARPWLRWLVDAAVLFAIVVAVGVWQTRAHVKGGPLPNASMPTLAGDAFDLGSLQGKPTLLAFWAPWCSVCESESSNISWVRRLAGQRANVVSIATAYEDSAHVERYVRRNDVDYPVLLDVSQMASALRVTSFPTVYFLDEAGHIKGSAVGYTTTLGLLLRTLW